MISTMDCPIPNDSFESFNDSNVLLSEEILQVGSQLKIDNEMWTSLDNELLYDTYTHDSPPYFDDMIDDLNATLMVNPNVLESGIIFGEDIGDNEITVCNEDNISVCFIQAREHTDGIISTDTPIQITDVVMEDSVKVESPSDEDKDIHPKKKRKEKRISARAPKLKKTPVDRENKSSKHTKEKTATATYDAQFNNHEFPKPSIPYACLITMALKNSKDGCLPVAEIYDFMRNHFPYFKTAPTGWKNSVRHNLSLNKCFNKMEKPPNATNKKGCLWTLSPDGVSKLEEDLHKLSKKDRRHITKAMVFPEYLDLLQKGELKNLSDENFDIKYESKKTLNTDLSVEVAAKGTNETTSKADCYLSDLPEFNAQVAEGIYDELQGDEQLFLLSKPILDEIGV